MSLSASRLLAYLTWLVATLTLLAEASTPVVVNGRSYEVDTVITRDVCVIGGGGSGTYAAIRLSDLGKTVAVVERKSRLGGHTETYTDPVTGAAVDIGVQVWHNTTIVRNFAARLNVSLVGVSYSATGITDYIDFRTGKIVTGYSPIEPSAADFVAYAEQLAKYPYLDNGFDLPDPIPSDLLLPFGDFVKKYSLQKMVGVIFGYGQGIGDLLSQPTLYVLKLVGLSILEALSTGFLTTALHDNSLIYEHATAILGKNVFLNSTILAVDRESPEGVKVLIKEPTGLTLIRSQKLVSAIPPKLNNLRGWDLSEREKGLFGQFSNAAYFTGLLRETGIPANVSITNTRNDTLYNLPVLPAIYTMGQTGVPGLVSVFYGSPSPLPIAEVKEAILSGVKKLQIPGKGPSNPELAVFSAHVPFECTVPASAIKAGFYKNLTGLQGQRHTYYTGGAFQTQDSSLLWQFTEALLPNITGVSGNHSRRGYA
jgi:hypothetical protein